MDVYLCIHSSNALGISIYFKMHDRYSRYCNVQAERYNLKIGCNKI